MTSSIRSMIVTQGAGQTIQLPDDQHVSVREMIEQSLQLGTIPSAPVAFSRKIRSNPAVFGAEACAVASSFVGRNACVADEHGCRKVSPSTLSLQYLFATQKAGILLSPEIVAQTFVYATHVSPSGVSVLNAYGGP